MNIPPREFGALEATVKKLEDDVSELKSEIKEMRRVLLSIDKTLSEARGGWKTLVAVGGAAGVAGAGLIKFAQWIQVIPK